MKHVPMPLHTERRFAPTALMLGNVVTGCSVLAPAGMLGELSSGLDVSIRTAGLLITFGAIMLCVGSPVTAWLTSRVERRTLLTLTLAALALTNFASAFAPDYTSLLIIRLVMLAVGALYTPQAAGTAGLIVLLLLITTLQMSGQFVVFTFMAPLLARLTGAGPDAIGLVFAVYGVCGVIGTAIGTRIVDSWGAWKTSLMFTLVLLAGVAGWALSAGIYPLMAVSVAIWGLGFASTNSMQQVRLVGAAPALASASVSLNTSVLYVGQAVGSAIGGLLYARDLLYASGYVASAFVALVLVTVILTKPRPLKAK